jgi:hypothetical protein
MAVHTATMQSDSLPESKAHLLKGLVRHVSAPYLHPIPDSSVPHATHQQMSKQHSVAWPRVSETSPWFTSSSFPEPSLTQSLVSHLLLERDAWRNTAEIQKRQLCATEEENKRQACAIDILKSQNTTLSAKHDEDIEAHNTLSARFRNVLNNHDKLIDQLNSSERTIARLKKSDRTKGKVWQRNLRLKATLGRLSSQVSLTPDQTAEATLLEALALANERIEELELKGEVLIHALEEHEDSYEEDEDEDGLDRTAHLMEAEVAFRGVLEDEMFREQREVRSDLLRE